MSILTIHLGVEYLTLSRLDFFQFTLVLGADRTTGHMTMSATPMVFITVKFGGYDLYIISTMSPPSRSEQRRPGGP